MNIAAKYHQPRRVKNLRWDRPLLRTVAPEIEPFRGGVGKNVVVGIIEVWELHSGADLHRQQRWKERQILLRNLFRRRRLWFRKRTIEVHDRERWLRREDAAGRDDFVAFRHDQRRMRFRQFYPPFNARFRENQNREQSEDCIERNDPAQAHCLLV